jgi:hypothetical protein
MGDPKRVILHTFDRISRILSVQGIRLLAYSDLLCKGHDSTISHASSLNIQWGVDSSAQQFAASAFLPKCEIRARSQEPTVSFNAGQSGVDVLNRQLHNETL